MHKISFDNSNAPFTVALKKKVDEYFSTQNTRLTGNTRLYLKTAILVSTAAVVYALLVFTPLPWWAALPLCALLGLAFAGIGFNVMHDGAHGSYSHKMWVNEVMAYSLNLLGGNAYLWKIKHNSNHHSFTNIEGMDEDIDIKPYMRTGPEQPRSWYHKYQHIYWVLLYCLVYFAWVFIKDFRKYFTGKIADTTFKKMSRQEHIIFWSSKIAYVGIFIVVPAITVGIVPALVGYAVMSVVCGFTLGIIFQLAHLVEGSSIHPVTEEPVRKMQDWTVHQLATTANFCTNNKLVTWFAGGLNFQVEHHLFPRVSHVHYPALNKVVKEVCAQFDVKYMEHPSFFSAVSSHVAYLKLVGNSK
jgi:linoleoyl-CoA desaturase